MTNRGRAVLARLTPKQKELVPLVAEGLSYREVGKRLAIGEQVVKNYLNQIFEKMCVHTRVEMLVFCYYHGVLQWPCSARAEKIAVAQAS